MDVDDVLLSPQDELLQLQQTLDLLAKDQEKMEAGIIKLHNRNRNIHETEVKYDSDVRNDYLKKTRSKNVNPGPGEYVYKKFIWHYYWWKNESVAKEKKYF